ncbi:MAG: hypothetical protein QXQ02_02230 [Halobacteria archaeon]
MKSTYIDQNGFHIHIVPTLVEMLRRNSIVKIEVEDFLKRLWIYHASIRIADKERNGEGNDK